jgi:hypothetical protein
VRKTHRLPRGSIRIFVVREMADARKGCEVKIDKIRFQPIGPGMAEEWVVSGRRRRPASRVGGSGGVSLFSLRCAPRVTLCNGRSHSAIAGIDMVCGAAGSERNQHAPCLLAAPGPVAILAPSSGSSEMSSNADVLRSRRYFPAGKSAAFGRQERSHDMDIMV